MKRVAYLALYWHPQSPEMGIETRRYVEELISRYRLKVREFRADRNSCYFSPLDADSKCFRDLMDEIERRADIDDVNLKIWPSYTRRELESSPLLVWYLTNQAIEDDYYDLHEEGYQGGAKTSHRRCGSCRAELEQVRDLVVDKRKMGRRALSLTYSFEIILSEQLAQHFREAGLTGFTLRPVQHYRKPYPNEPVLYQLVVTHTLPPMASPPTAFEGVQHCSTCGTTTRFLKHTHFWGQIQYYEETDIYYHPEALTDAQDFNRTAEVFGELPTGHPLVLVSQRVYRLLREQGVKGWEVVPVYLTEGREGQT